MAPLPSLSGIIAIPVFGGALLAGAAHAAPTTNPGLTVAFGLGSAHPHADPPTLEQPQDGKAPPESDTQPPLEVVIDRASVDLAAHRLVLTMSRAPDHVHIKVLSVSGAILAEQDQDFRSSKAGVPLTVSWNPRSEEAVARIEVYAYDTDGYYKGIAITPWSLSIPHEELHFKTNASQILPGEEPKLEASLKLIREAWSQHKDLGPVALFVVGHTDTVGTAADNQKLSEKRAQAIAVWFRAHGLTLPIAYAGAGELILKAATPDQVDEPANRRADYLLALEPPHLRAAESLLVFRQL